MKIDFLRNLLQSIYAMEINSEITFFEICNNVIFLSLNLIKNIYNFYTKYFSAIIQIKLKTL